MNPRDDQCGDRLLYSSQISLNESSRTITTSSSTIDPTSTRAAVRLRPLGPAAPLSPEQFEEWRTVAASADVFFDFDWLDPSTMAERCPNLKWIQGTSAGIGGVMQRTGLDRTSIVATTAGGIHAVPLAEFALMGALYFVKGLPLLSTRKAQHHWERYTTG